jgi:hypothetical protein
MANWLDKYEQGGLVLKKKTKDNYGKKENANAGHSTAGPGWVGEGTTNRGFDYNGAWGGTMQNGGFLQPTSYKLPSAANEGAMSTEKAISIGGGPGEPAYLIPSFKYGKPLKDPEAEYRKTGEHLGGPFKTWQEAEKFGEMRHKYVEQGRNIPSPLKWWDDMKMGGSMPGSVGFTYARTAGSAPANGKYTKKTKASAQNGTEMKFYQEGLDFKPKSISKNGSVIKDDMGQWAHPGEITEIGSNDITMQGVDYPVLGISDTGDTQMMYPDQDYKFDGEKVTEYPMAQNGDWLSKYSPEPVRQDATRNVIPRRMTDKEKLEAVATSDQAQKKALNNAKEVIEERKKNKATKGDLNTPGSWHIADKLRVAPNSVGGVGEIFDEYVNIPRFVGSIADNLGEGVAKRDVGQVAGAVGEATLAGVLGIDPLTAMSKAPRKLLNAADRNFSNVGQRLVQIEKEGIKKGWDPQTIKQKQMDAVGITSSQREAYTPVLSDIAEKYITPYGYSGMQGESKLQQIINNIKQGGVKFPKTDNALMRTEVSPERSDAWRLYLGKPQQHYTFRIANTSPVNHPSYTPEQLSKMDIYSINSDFGKLGVKPFTEFPNLVSPREIEQNMNMLRNKTTVDTGNEIMGGYNRRLNQYGLEYNDVWDLQPAITPANYLPNNLKYTLGESPLFSKTSKEGVISPRYFKVDGSMFLGKPFMSHEVLPYTSTNLKEEMENIIKTQMDDLKNSKFDMTPKINRLEAYKEELKQYPKYKKGGWLNKYK